MDKWDIRFMEMAKVVSTWTSCFAPGRAILRRKLGIESGTRAEVCYAAHAEQNAILQAAKLGISIDGATLYCTHQPCSICAKMIVNAGIKRVIYEQGYPDAFTLEIFGETGVLLEKYEE